MWQNPLEIADLVKFTEEIRNGKLHFLCSARQGLNLLTFWYWFSNMQGFHVLKKELINMKSTIFYIPEYFGNILSFLQLP